MALFFVALAAIPVFVIGSASSAGRSADVVVARIEAVATTTTSPAPSSSTIANTELPTATVLTARAAAWTSARADSRVIAREQAIQLARDVAARQDALDTFLASLEEPEPPPETSSSPTTAPPPLPTPESAPAAPPPTTTAPAPSTTAVPSAPETAEPPAPPTAIADPALDWAGLRQCESSGNYGAISSNGSYRGAYQFSRATWDWVAAVAYPHLVGVDPAAAAAGDQDVMALTLYQMRGRGQWPTCGPRFLA